MPGTRIWAALLLAGLAACSPEDQSPFELDPDAEVEKEIGSSGGTISTPAGLSVEFPSGALSSNTTVGIKPVSGSGLGAGLNGSIVAGTAYEITPRGRTLSTPARIELAAANEPGDRSESLIAAPNAQFNPLSYLGYFFLIDTGTKVELGPGITLDIGRSTYSGDISTLGTIAVGRTTPLALRTDGFSTPTGGAIPSGSYTLECGLLDATPCVDFETSSSFAIFTDPIVLSRYPNIGAIITDARGALTFNDQSKTVTGSVVINGVVQIVLGGVVNSKEITIDLASGGSGTAASPQTVSYQTSGNEITFMTNSGQRTFRYSATATQLDLVLAETTIRLTDDDDIERDYPISVFLRLKK